MAAAAALALAVVLLFQVGEASAQIDFRQIFCGILIAVRNAFANSPFFGFIAAAINALIAAFGCGVS